MGAALGDPDGGGDVAQPDSGVASHADQDMRVVRQEVPAGGGVLRDLCCCCHIGRLFHELVVLCSYGYKEHPILRLPWPAASPIPSASPILRLTGPRACATETER